MNKSYLYSAILLSVLSCKTQKSEETETKSDVIDSIATDAMLFVPSYGYKVPGTNTWNLNVFGWSGKLNESQTIENAAIDSIESFTGYTSHNRGDTWARIRSYIGIGRPFDYVKMDFNGVVKERELASTSGLIETVVSVTDSELADMRMQSGGWVTFRTYLHNGNPAAGAVKIIQPEGLSIISDIDDTIKITGVTKGIKVLVANTFLRKSEASPKVAELMQSFKSQGTNVEYHYLSGSPWQSYNYLKKFVVSDGFPTGTFHLRTYTPDGSFFDVNKFVHIFDAKAYKIAKVKEIMESFPKRKFILVGDSGEKDPEVYAWALETFPNRVNMVYIRNVTNEGAGSARYNDLFGNQINKLKIIDELTGEIE